MGIGVALAYDRFYVLVDSKKVQTQSHTSPAYIVGIFTQQLTDRPNILIRLTRLNRPCYEDPRPPAATRHEHRFTQFASQRMCWVILTTLFLCFANAYAGPNPTLDSQRFHYQKAKVALSRNQISAYQTHYDALGDYPLKQYLEFAHIRKQLNTLPYKQIDAFLAQYPNTFLETRLKFNLLNKLADKRKWQAFLKYYPPNSPTTALKCQALRAKLALDHPVQINTIAEVWNVGQSQPKACDPLFKTLLKQKKIPQWLIWSRLHKAIKANKTGLARYLKTHLDESYLAHAEQLLKIHRNPELVKNRASLQAQDLPTQQIIAHGIQRLARKKPLDALYHWELYEAQQIFPDNIRTDTKLYVVKRLIRKGHTQEAQHLLAYSHQLREKKLVEEVIREALTQLDWVRVNDTIGLLDARTQREERWLYWRARAQDELGVSFPGFLPSTLVYQTLAQNRSFYGFLSSDLLSQKYSLVDHSEKLTAPILSSMAKRQEMQRIHELWITGHTTEARAEWAHSSAQFKPNELMAAGQLARSWGWYAKGIQAMIVGNLWNQLTVRFPLAYQEQIYQTASDTQVEPTLLYAIARQESAFDEQAKSPVGAMGLMQLMPKTAQYTAKMFGINHKKTKQLHSAEHNMRLGGHYLSHLLERFEGNRILAAAAYNAGPHRVKRWLSEEGKERPFDVWIETIPYGETRQYVQNVLCFSVIYGYRLGQPTTFVSEDEANQFL